MRQGLSATTTDGRPGSHPENGQSSFTTTLYDMNAAILPPLLTGVFALAGALSGGLLTGILNILANKKRQGYEDTRRWLSDRRQIYAHYLSLCEAMLREVDNVACFLPYYGPEEIDKESESFLKDGLFEYITKWDDELQPALFEVQLMASPDVADLAERVSGALMCLTTYIERREAFTEYYPTWFQCQDLLQVLRNAMRTELSLPPLKTSWPHKAPGWPWLKTRPPREQYIQHHPRPEKSTSDQSESDTEE
ncbi:hypothetical protein N8J89_08275 [Crossiella sp. CA-258035]|uniref:hypothetical protein n=1 Tax=Crossiella sp. CA-258035 TaxID=2981138 RepID=UPI0024BC362C|nr:hypothetical protein [Crossiella sp. CA-258035]WHT21049.1 hypothetical protein N8J89_08275 [Crossiella sp. CA-258035]